MDLKYKNGEIVSESVGLLISILIRYPEVGSLNFNPDDQVITLSFNLGQVIEEQSFNKFKENLLSCLETFNYLENNNVKVLEINNSVCELITVIEVKRDVNSVTRDEIALLITFIQQQFGDFLMKDSDSNESIQEEDLILQEELIGHMLENLRESKTEKKLIAFREEGKVHVFKK